MNIKKYIFKLAGHKKEFDKYPYKMVKIIKNGILTVSIRTHKYKHATPKNPIYVRTGGNSNGIAGTNAFN